MAFDPSTYEARRRGLNDDYTARTATNAYSRFLSQQRGDRNIADYSRDYRRQAPSVTAQYGRRNLATGGVQSGVYGRAMQNYTGDYSQNLDRMYADQQSELRTHDLTAAELATSRDRALSDMEADKAKEIAMAASYLSALRPQYGM